MPNTSSHRSAWIARRERSGWRNQQGHPWATKLLLARSNCDREPASWKATSMPDIYQRRGETYIAMHEEPYRGEKVPQRLIASHPENLAGDDAPHGRPNLVPSEAGMPPREGRPSPWSPQHLHLDAKRNP